MTLSTLYVDVVEGERPAIPWCVWWGAPGVLGVVGGIYGIVRLLQRGIDVILRAEVASWLPRFRAAAKGR
jgi:hypothetical protein